MDGASSALLPDGKAVAITVVRGPDTGAKFEFTSARIVIGRKRGDVLLQDRETSSMHASIECAPDGRFIVKDLGSTNGTWLDGKRITVAEIHPGQHLKVGANHLLFTVADAQVEATRQGRLDERRGNVSFPDAPWPSTPPPAPARGAHAPAAGREQTPVPPPSRLPPAPPPAPAPAPPPARQAAPLPPAAPAAWPTPPPAPPAPAPVAGAPWPAPPSAPAGAQPPVPPPPPWAAPAPVPVAPAAGTPSRAAPPPLPPLPPWPSAPAASEPRTDISVARPVPSEPPPARASAGRLPPGVERSVYGIYLVVERGRDRGRAFAINRQVTVLGRSGTEILINDPDISRRHAALDVQGEGKYVLRDLHSTNGTLLNGVAIETESITANDKIRMGSTTIKLVVGDDRLVAELQRVQEEPAHP